MNIQFSENGVMVSFDPSTKVLTISMPSGVITTRSNDLKFTPKEPEYKNIPESSKRDYSNIRKPYVD